MKEITYFYLKTCPYCRQADEMIRQLISEEPKYAEVPVKKIEEREFPEIADSYDYYFVPCFYIGDRKMMEGVPTMDMVKAAFQAALE